MEALNHQTLQVGHQYEPAVDEKIRVVEHWQTECGGECVD